MAVFVSGGRVAICATGEINETDVTPELDVMFIRPAMDYGTRQRVIGMATKVKPSTKKQKHMTRAERKKQQDADVNFDVGVYQIALLLANLLSWQGPSFVGVPLTQANVERLDPNDPLVKAVLDALAERNVTDDDAEGDDPNVIDLEPTSLTTTSESYATSLQDSALI